MALTLSYALQNFPIFSQAAVVAGHKGLQRTVRWAHIVDLPDVEPWVREGDLLLTTAFALKDNFQAQVDLIPLLAQKGLAGVLFALGTYFQDIPEEMVDLANQLDFPILTLPWEVPFVEVTRAIHEHILREQYTLIEKSLHIHEVLTRLVIEGKSLDDIVASLAELLNRSVTIEDASLRVLAHASCGPVDEMRRRSIEEGQTPQALMAYLEKDGLFERLRKDPRPQRVPSRPEWGMTLERTIAPILVGSQLYGYVWIIATEGPLTELDFLAIEQAAMVAALAFTRQQAIFEAEQRVKASLLDNLLEPDAHRDIRGLRDTLAQLGLSHGYQVLALDVIEGQLDMLSFSALVESELASESLPGTLIQRGERLIVLIGTPDAQHGEHLAYSLVEAAERRGVCLVAGIGMPNSAETHLRQSYVEAVESLRVGKSLARGKSGVWPFESLGFLHWGSNVPRDVLVNDRYHRLVREIAAYDLSNDDDCLNTLEAYLDFNGNKLRISQELFIHRNTLRHRMAKIEQTWGINFDDPFAMMNLYMAIKQWRLDQGIS